MKKTTFFYILSTILVSMQCAVFATPEIVDAFKTYYHNSDTSKFKTILETSDLKFNDTKQTVLHIVFPLLAGRPANEFKKTQNLIKFFQSQGVAINAQDSNGNTVLHYTYMSRVPTKQELIKYLVTLGANPNILNNKGQFPEDIKAESKLFSKEKEKSFQENLDQQDITGMTKLMKAVNDDNLARVDSLIKAAANLNIQDSSGWTALIYAAYNNKADIAKLLLEAGADYKLKPKLGIIKNAYELAVERNSDETISVFNTFLKQVAKKEEPVAPAAAKPISQ